jgi:hypothetical protein
MQLRAKLHRLLRVSGATVLVTLSLLIFGAICDINKNGHSGLLNPWREGRITAGYVMLVSLLAHSCVPGFIRGLNRRWIAITIILSILWLLLDPGWPRM